MNELTNRPNLSDGRSHMMGSSKDADRFAHVFSDGSVRLTEWNGSTYLRSKLKLGSYRKAQRVARMFINGYNFPKAVPYI